MIECIDINKWYGDLHVLKDVNFTSKDAEIVSIVGASGAGKSTLLQIMGTLLKPESGKVLIDGVDVNTLGNRELGILRNSRIGFVFQFHHLLPEFTAVENIMIPALIAGKEKTSIIKEKALALLKEVGLEERAEHKPSQLSGGECQRVAIARAIINNPSVIFADEPSGNLDSHTKQDIHQLFFSLREKHGQTIIIVTHDNSLATMADRMVTMQDGIIL